MSFAYFKLYVVRTECKFLFDFFSAILNFSGSEWRFSAKASFPRMLGYILGFLKGCFCACTACTALCGPCWCAVASQQDVLLDVVINRNLPSNVYSFTRLSNLRKSTEQRFLKL